MKSRSRLGTPFFEVIEIPPDAPVFDFSTPEAGERYYREVHTPWGIGKYAENRPEIYRTPLFGGERTVHMGIDLFAPAGSPVFAVSDSKIHSFGYNSAAGDYGYVVVLELLTAPYFALYGHLGPKSIANKTRGQILSGGEWLGELGDPTQNGGYPPHLHFQLSTQAPSSHDMPGAVAPRDLELAKTIYPDPRIVLGALY